VFKRARTAHEVRALLTEAKVTTGHRLFRFVGLDSYEAAGGNVTRDLFAKDGEGYADDPELVQRLADEKLDRLTTEAEAEGWGEVIAAEQTPYQSYNWHRLSPDESEGSYSAEAKAGAVLLIVVDHQGGTTATAYTRTIRRIVPRDEGGTPLPRPLYDARMTEELSRMRTAALQAEVAKNQRLAFAVLLDALLPILTKPYALAHAVQLRAGTAIQEAGQVFDYNTREMASPFEGVADLIASVPEDEAERFAWALALDDDSVARLLAACTGALIDATQGKYADAERLRSVDRIARAANLDMRDHWEAGVEFFGAISKKAMLAALTEACGVAAAENCAKLGKQDLAVACAERIPGRGWLPPALLTPDAPALADLSDENGDEAGNDNNDMDADMMAVAAE
jgi:ParB family chromosome partitioning protein